MADTAVAVFQLVANTVSERVDGTTPGADIMVSVSTGNVAVISANGYLGDVTILISGDGTHTATVTPKGGVEPPGEQSGFGDGSGVSVAATGTYVLPLLASQFDQANGTIRLAVSGTGPVYIGAVRKPLTQ